MQIVQKLCQTVAVWMNFRIEMWVHPQFEKNQDFSVTHIFLDINFGECRSSKIAVVCYLSASKEGVHLSIWEILAKFFGGKACGAT